jgi:hypothetical protein
LRYLSTVEISWTTLSNYSAAINIAESILQRNFPDEIEGVFEKCLVIIMLFIHKGKYGG